MSRRAHRDKCVLGFALHDGIDRLTRRAGAAQSRFHRVNRNGGVRVEITGAIVYDTLYSLEVLGSMTGLNVTATCFGRFNLNRLRPKLSVSPQRVHYDGVSFRPFRMAGASVMFFEDRVMNDGGRHGS